LDGDHWKSTTFSTFTTSFAIVTIANIRRSIGYWIADEETGNITSFCNVQTTKSIGTNCKPRFVEGQPFELGLRSILV